MNEATFHVTRSSLDGVTVIGLSGSIDLETHDELARTLADLRDSEREPLMLDLQGISYLDSGGLFHLLNFSRGWEEKTGNPPHFLIDPDESAFTRRIFETARLEQILPIHLSQEEALAAIRAPRV